MKLRTQDLRLFNLVFESDAGWIMDFSNRTLTAFFDEELNIDIDDERYCEDGSSKAKRVRCLLKKADRETVLQVLDKLWGYKVQFHPDNAEAAHHDYLLLISRLSESGDEAAAGEKPVPSWHHINYAALTTEMDRMKMLSPHERGFRFEAWLGELFHTFHLAPRKSFRNTGEQIDGSFRLNNDIYLMEAKWHQKKTPAADLHVFEGKLSTKATWTRGVFISWMGFTPDGLTAFGKGKRVIGVDGYDLYHSLKKGIPFPLLLEAKVRHAAETGEPFVRFDQLAILTSVVGVKN
ncbi:TPA: restriction endonuclease [Yersinia enterocolitica]|nr:restriction endonuclease [Yersinia enterocolitica]